MTRMQSIRTISVVIACAALLGLGQGCSSFERKWEAAGEGSAADEVAGRWEGQWTNEPNGTSGRLRCVILPAEADGEYRVHFEAERWRMVTQTSVATLKPQQTNNVYHFDATANMGPGLYHYRGQIIGSRFTADYFRSVEDYGRFEMSRLE